MDLRATELPSISPELDEAGSCYAVALREVGQAKLALAMLEAEHAQPWAVEAVRERVAVGRDRLVAAHQRILSLL